MFILDIFNAVSSILTVASAALATKQQQSCCQQWIGYTKWCVYYA